MLCYLDRTVDVKRPPRFDKIKEISDLANTVLADGMHFAYKQKAKQVTLDNKTYHFKINKIN